MTVNFYQKNIQITNIPELIQYATSEIKLKTMEAESLYAGIMMDTKNFTFKTGVRTFEAAAYLRKYGVDIIRVKKWFQADLESYNEIAKEIAKINITYNDYKEYTEIDISQYKFLILYSSSLEDISQHLKKIKEEDKSYHKAILKLINKPHISNVVVRSATEDEANKFNLFKLICLNPNSTALQLSEKMKMDKEYILGLLFELNKVDGLISFTYGDDWEEDNVLWFKR